ncbi:MAG: 2Fe-2S iron-sulfur cluster-binding protein, partial [Oscillospiraceae bacterium]|nr:2Fe-2S iron-sulfur cluster-binding protein [Oscillospiraceae bacterium]
MSEIKISLDGREFTGTDNQTILEIAQKNNIEIPTLCHDERVEMYGACGLCTVEIEGSPKLFRACCTIAANGMRVKTNTERIIKNRRTALELLLGDHFGDCLPPCTLACPAKTDCQGYAKFIAEEKYDEALKLIKEKIPFPSSIGRICPHPCEEACRRELVEESVSICALKQFAGDLNIEYNPEPGPPTYKHAAIVGGGPGGLAAAYFLRIQGHKATIYDAMPEMGGMLFYGVPEYRLPKEILRKEIECVKKMGVDFVNNTKIGRDISLNHLR